MWKALRLVTEPGHRSEQAPWGPSLLVAAFASVFFALPWALQAAAFAPGQLAIDAAAMFVAHGLVTSALALRRHFPGLELLLGIIGSLLQVILLSPVPNPAVPLIIYDYARWGARHNRISLYAGLLGALVGPAVWLNSSYFGVGWQFSPVVYLVLAVGSAGLVVAAYAIGRFFRSGSDRELERQQNAAERMRHALAEQEHRTRTAEATARNQIARELHDVVAHNLSVIVVQAEGGRALAERRPDKAAEVLTTIADISREALGERRRIDGVLREDPATRTDPRAAPSAEYGPAPMFDDIGDMVRRAGEQFEFFEQGTAPARAPAALQLTAYRVVQEAVTNVLKHGGENARAEVTITYHPTSVEISIMDDGRGNASHNDRRGHGLKGMHERVHAMGGQLVARPRRGGGFAVHGVLPLPVQGRELKTRRMNPTPTQAPERSTSDQPVSDEPTLTRRTTS